MANKVYVAKQLSLLITAAVYAGAAAASPGAIDGTFGTGGVTLQPTQIEANALALQPDGKLVTAGYAAGTKGYTFALARFAADGTPDDTFGIHGVATTAIGPGNSVAQALAVQPDGMLITAGYTFNGTDNDIAVVRYDARGGVDRSFVGGGAVVHLGNGTDQAYALALMSDGRIVVAGTTQTANGDLDFAVLRFLPNGLLDPTFGTDGVVTTAVSAGNDVATAVVVQPDGKIVAAGYANNGNDYDFALVRYDFDGTLDTGFAGDGTLTVAMGPAQDYATSLLLQPDGKLVAAGASQQGGAYRFAVLRCNPDGSLDNGFGNGGTVVTSLGGDNDLIQGVLRQPTGELVAAGYTVSGGVNTAALVRYTPDGRLDNFGTNGIVRTSLAATNSAFNAVVLQPDGKLVAAGYAGPTGSGQAALARYTAIDTPWGLSPDPFSFSRLVNADQNAVETSNVVTISGLENGIAVPVIVSGGEYAQNGATTFTSQPGWAKNGDQFKLRHVSKTGTGQVAATVLIVGGLQPNNNSAMVLGAAGAGEFTSETNYSAAAAWDPWSLGVLGLLWAGVRRRSRCMPS